MSTGNVGTAVASLAAKAGVDAYVFYPNRLEDTKARACMALGAKVCQVEGNYDEANKRCRELAESDGHGLRQHHAAAVLRRGREDRRLRDRRAARLAGTRPHRHRRRRRHAVLTPAQGPARAAAAGLAETDSTRIHIAQPSGCNPIATAIVAEEAEIHAVTPETAAHSLAIGNPGDGYLVIDAVLKRGGTGGFASDPEIFAGIDLLAATEGLLTEPAGGTTIAVLEKLAAAGRFDADDDGRGDHHRQRAEDARRPPAEAWPAKVDCELDAMIAALNELKRGASLLEVAHEQLG